jgi:hypothetical protein
MLFNKTADGLPVVRPFRTDDALLARCQYVSKISLEIVFDSPQILGESRCSYSPVRVETAHIVHTIELEKRKSCNLFICDMPEPRPVFRIYWAQI